MALFLRRRKVLDYELFEQQAINNNRTYEFITSMQEIKLQDCEQRKRKEWEEIQVNLFRVQQKSLKLQQTQEAGSIFINEVKNIVVTVVAATAVIQGHMTLGMMLAVQYIIGQLNSPVEQLMGFFYSVQDVKISLERINEIHHVDDENGKQGLVTTVKEENQGIELEAVNFKYDPHALKTIIDDVSLTIPKGKVTAIVGASGSGKTTLIKLMLGYYPVLGGQISIGYHGNVPSLMKYYGKDPKTIVKCLVYGTLMALALYTIWLLATMGNIPRPEFIGIAEKGGNIDVLVQALSGVLNSRSLDLLLVVFSNFAVASSFLGVTLGLFDYLADLFGFDDSAVGRLKTALLTFAPPVVGGLLFPNGFLYAIGYAGLAATIWAAIVPALLARASRKRFGSPKFRVWGGKPMIALILVFGVGNALVHILSSFNLLPVYQ